MMTETFSADPGVSHRLDVSVVIAAYNAAAFLAGAVASALAQEGVSLEVIVADDASSDDTVAVAGALASADGRVRVLATETNGGPACARNRAIAVARGDWIAVLDADDRFLPGRLAGLLAFAEKKDADIVFDLFREVDAEGAALPDLLAPPFTAERRWSLAEWAAENAPRRSAASISPGYLKPLMRRSFLERNALAYHDLRNSEDYLLIAESLAAGAAIWGRPEVGYLYTRRPGSISHRIGPSHIEALLAAERRAFPDLAKLAPAAAGALRDRWSALENTLACERVIEALKMRRPVAPLRILASRPQAIGAVMAWAGEALSKRAGSRAR